MSTRSTISYELPDGSVKSIYCHFDGYLDGVGMTLLRYYKTLEQVEKLVNLGALSVLGEVPESDPEYWNVSGIYDPGKCCIAYRDRGDRDAGSTAFASVHELLKETGYHQDYNYLYCKDDSGDYHWVVWYCNEKVSESNILTENLLSSFLIFKAEDFVEDEDGFCVRLLHLASDKYFWFNIWTTEDDVTGDWNQCVFLNDSEDDNFRYDVQGSANNFSAALEESIDFLRCMGKIGQDYRGKWHRNMKEEKEIR